MDHISKEEVQNLIEDMKKELIELLGNNGNRVYTILRHCSKSGMTRWISTVIKTSEGISDISWYVSKILDMKRNDDHGGGIKIGGCGMDMGFNLVYCLSLALFCPKKYDHASAYKLTQEWL